VRLSRERIGSRWSAFAARRSRRIRSFLKTFDLNNKSLSEIEQEEEDRARAIQLLQGDEYLFRDSFPFFLSPFRSLSVHPPPPPPPPPPPLLLVLLLLLLQRLSALLFPLLPFPFQLGYQRYLLFSSFFASLFTARRQFPQFPLGQHVSFTLRTVHTGA